MEIIRPSSHIFSSPQSIVREKIPVPIVERVDETARILRYIKNAPFPNKGFPFPEAVTMADVAKKLLRSTFRWYSPRKSLTKYADWAYPYIRPYELGMEHRTECAEEVFYVAVSLCSSLNLPIQLANIGSYIIQYDNAYRLIFEDVMSESRESYWLNPYKEVNRLLDILIARTHGGHYKKRYKRLKSLTVILKLPSIDKAITTTMLNCNLPALQLDDTDRYWASMRGEYDFFGQKVEDRYPAQVPDYVMI